MADESKEYLREIRNWVRFIGILIVAGVVVATCIGVSAGAGIVNAFG